MKCFPFKICHGLDASSTATEPLTKIITNQLSGVLLLCPDASHELVKEASLVLVVPGS